MVDTKEVLIYVLKHPDTLEIRYVGKTINSLKWRLGKHIDNAKGNKHNKHLSNWILKILKDNKKPLIELLETCNETNWQEREKYWIKQYSNLLNMTIGGDGCEGFKHNKETLEKLSKINLGKKHTQEFKNNMSKRLKGVALTEEHKNNIRKALLGKHPSLETREKLSESHKGIQQSEESRRKRSQTIKQWWAKRKASEDIVKS